MSWKEGALGIGLICAALVSTSYSQVKGGKKPPDSPVIVVFRDASTDKLSSDTLGAYVHGEPASGPVEAIFFGSGNPGNLRLTVFRSGRGGVDAERDASLDLSDLAVDEGVPTPVQSRGRFLFAAADQGNGVNLIDNSGKQVGMQQVSQAWVADFQDGRPVDFNGDGSSDGNFAFDGVPARILWDFAAPNGGNTDWRLHWTIESLRAIVGNRIVGFGTIVCAATETTPANPCGGAWRVRPGEVWVDGNDANPKDGVIQPGELVANGSANLRHGTTDAGVYRVPTEFVVCLKSQFNAAACESLVGASP